MVNKVKLSALRTFIQYHAASSNQSNETVKEIKGILTGKRRNNTFLIHRRHNCVYRTSGETYQKKKAPITNK